MSNPLKADPTRTTTLRMKFMRDLTKRYLALKGLILKLVVEEDAFGLKKDKFSVNTRWSALTDDQKLNAFRLWLAEQVEQGILTITADGHIAPAYAKGVTRSFTDVKGSSIDLSPDAFQGTKQEFLRQSLGGPVAVEKVELLASRTLNDLKGVTDAMAQQMSGVLVDGLIAGDSPRVIARNLNRRVDKIGRTRSMTIARTEIVRAHAEGQLDALENLGVTEIGVLVEWNTTGDDRVCQLCQPLDGVVLKIKEARGIIPRHPNCRCAFTPANVGERIRGQKRTRTQIQGAISKSVRGEAGGRGRSLATKRRRSQWAGAGKRISKKRPKRVAK